MHIYAQSTIHTCPPHNSQYSQMLTSHKHHIIIIHICSRPAAQKHMITNAWGVKATRKNWKINEKLKNGKWQGDRESKKWLNISKMDEVDAKNQSQPSWQPNDDHLYFTLKKKNTFFVFNNFCCNNRFQFADWTVWTLKLFEGKIMNFVHSFFPVLWH